MNLIWEDFSTLKDTLKTTAIILYRQITNKLYRANIWNIYI